MSVRPSSEMFCTIMSTFTPASDSGPKMAAAMPGRFGPKMSTVLTTDAKLLAPAALFTSPSPVTTVASVERPYWA